MGVYTVLSQEFQLAFVRRLMASIKGLPALPKDTVEPVIVTGFEALGRNHTLNKLRAFIADVQQSLADRGLARLNGAEVMKRLATGYGIEDADALLKSDDEMSMEAQNAAAMSLGEKAAGPMAGVAAKAMMQQ